jgi:hypothetical protein
MDYQTIIKAKSMRTQELEKQKLATCKTTTTLLGNSSKITSKGPLKTPARSPIKPAIKQYIQDHKSSGVGEKLIDKSNKRKKYILQDTAKKILCPEKDEDGKYKYNALSSVLYLLVLLLLACNWYNMYLMHLSFLHHPFLKNDLFCYE